MRHVAGGKALIALWCAGILSALVLLTGTALATDAGTTAELTGGDLKKPVVVYCASGHRAGKAQQVLDGTAVGMDAPERLRGLRG